MLQYFYGTDVLVSRTSILNLGCRTSNAGHVYHRFQAEAKTHQQLRLLTTVYIHVSVVFLLYDMDLHGLDVTRRMSFSAPLV